MQWFNFVLTSLGTKYFFLQLRKIFLSHKTDMNKKTLKKKISVVCRVSKPSAYGAALAPLIFFLGGGSSSRGHNTLQCYLRHFENSSTILNIMFSEAGTRAGPN